MSSLFAIAAALAAAAVLDGMNGVTRHALRCAVLLIFTGALGHALGNAAADSLAYAGMAAFMLADRRADTPCLHDAFAPAVQAFRYRARIGWAVAAMAVATAVTTYEWFA